MKISHPLVAVISSILGISFGIYLITFPAAQTAIWEPVTEEYYEMLKEKAINVARTLDVNVVNDDTLTADFYLSQDVLVVTVKSFKAKITATVPISGYSVDIGNEIVNFRGITEFESVKYTIENELQPAWWYIVMTSIMSLGVGVGAYFVICTFPLPTKKS